MAVVTVLQSSFFWKDGVADHLSVAQMLPVVIPILELTSLGCRLAHGHLMTKGRTTRQGQGVVRGVPEPNLGPWPHSPWVLTQWAGSDLGQANGQGLICKNPPPSQIAALQRWPTTVGRLWGLESGHMVRVPVLSFAPCMILGKSPYTSGAQREDPS